MGGVKGHFLKQSTDTSSPFFERDLFIKKLILEPSDDADIAGTVSAGNIRKRTPSTVLWSGIYYCPNEPI
jgi:hypothetical protein